MKSLGRIGLPPDITAFQSVLCNRDPGLRFDERCAATARFANSAARVALMKHELPAFLKGAGCNRRPSARRTLGDAILANKGNTSSAVRFKPRRVCHTLEEQWSGELASLKAFGNALRRLGKLGDVFACPLLRSSGFAGIDSTTGHANKQPRSDCLAGEKGDRRWHVGSLHN